MEVCRAEIHRVYLPAVDGAPPIAISTLLHFTITEAKLLKRARMLVIRYYLFGRLIAMATFKIGIPVLHGFVRRL
jgi:hypothetical protein